MHRARILWMFPFLLAMALSLVLAQAAFGQEETGGDAAVPDDVLETVDGAVNSLGVTEELRTRLRETARDCLCEGLAGGLNGEQIRLMAEQMIRLYGAVDLEEDEPYLGAAFQLMIRAMAGGATAEEVATMLQQRLAAGENLEAALQQTRTAFMGGEAGETGKPDTAGTGKPDTAGGSGNGNGSGQGKGKG